MASRLLATASPATELDKATILAKKIRYLNKIESVPKPPQRSTNSWQLFLQDRLTVDMKSGNFVNVTQSSRQAGAEWRNMSEAQKQPYVERATVLSIEHKNQYERWLASLSSADVAVYNRMQRLRRKQGKTGKLLADPKKPKRPLTSYFRFLAEQRQQAHGDTPMVEQSAQAAQKWNSMTDAQKKPYVDQQAKDMAAYRNAYANYSEQLPKPIDLGKALKPPAKKKPAKKVVKKVVKKKVAKKPVKKVVKKPAAKKTVKKVVKKTAAKQTTRKA